MERIHATTIALDGRAVLLRGPSGCGKSDLALRLIDQGASLVADDYTEISNIDGRVFCTPPEAIRDSIELRGIGVVQFRAVDNIELGLIIDLVEHGDIERLPEPLSEPVAGVQISRFRLNAFAASTPAKIRFLMKAAKTLGKE
jgi:HPr kinase/phosphorylase